MDADTKAAADRQLVISRIIDAPDKIEWAAGNRTFVHNMRRKSHRPTWLRPALIVFGAGT